MRPICSKCDACTMAYPSPRVKETLAKNLNAFAAMEPRALGLLEMPRPLGDVAVADAVEMSGKSVASSSLPSSY